jgi:hypothetical protein
MIYIKTRIITHARQQEPEQYLVFWSYARFRLSLSIKSDTVASSSCACSVSYYSSRSAAAFY